MEPIIAGRDLRKSWGATLVLEHADFLLHAGEKVALVGRNGSGKSTLFRLLAGETAPDLGDLVLKPGLRYGYLPQVPNVPRAKGYVTRFLSLHRSGEDKSLMRGVFAPGEKPASGGPLEEELPKVVGILEGIEHDRNLEKKSLGEAKAFLIALEQKLTKMAEEQEGPALETWRFAHKQ